MNNFNKKHRKSFGKSILYWVGLAVLVMLVKAGVPPILFIVIGIICAVIAVLKNKQK